ncbi:membrane protein [Gordonia phage MoontowerMania]|nr:membrane protein [Gordonia phage MoontowerMania]
MAGYRPKPSPGGVTPSRIPPAGGGGVAHERVVRALRDTPPRITAVVHVGRREVARFGDRGDLIAASSRFWDTLRSEDPDTIDVWLAPDVSDKTRDRVTDVLRDAEQHAQRRREAARAEVAEVAAAAVMDVDTAERFDAHLMGAGVLFDPNAAVRRARRDPVMRWPIADLVEHFAKPGIVAPPLLPEGMTLEQFAGKLVEQAKNEGRDVCGLVRDHLGLLVKVVAHPAGDWDCERQLATTGDAPFDDWGSSGEPEQVDLMLRIFRALVAFMVAVPRAIREHPRTYFGIGVPVILIGTGQVGGWLAGIDWPVVIVSTLIVLAGVFVVALSVSRRNYRREIEAERAALAERAQKQHEEWLKE